MRTRGTSVITSTRSAPTHGDEGCVNHAAGNRTHMVDWELSAMLVRGTKAADVSSGGDGR